MAEVNGWDLGQIVVLSGNRYLKETKKFYPLERERMESFGEKK